MDSLDSVEPAFRDAVRAIDAGDVDALERLLRSNPALVRERAQCGQGYFQRPYLLWFVAENPVRTGRVPANAVEIARAIVEAARRERTESLREQLDYALALVATGRVPRESGVQLELIDFLIDAGANPGSTHAALAHRELAAVERLLERGAELTFATAIGTGRAADVARLAPKADARGRQVALAAAALYGDCAALAMLVGLGVDVSAYSSEIHEHATALHHAVSSGSLDAVQVLVDAGADLRARDRAYDGTPLDWAEHLGHTEIAAYLRAKAMHG